MTRGRRFALVIAAGGAVLLALNAIGTANETKEAELTVEGAEIMQLGGGSLQVLDEEPPLPRSQRGLPIVLLHCYTCSMRWWDNVGPPLNERHRIIRIDLLGHGGSEKPADGYEVDAQAEMVAEVLNELGIEGAMVVGHSLGATVATSLAQNHSELVDRVGLIGATGESGEGELSLTAKISRAPVIGEAMWRILPDFVLRSGVSIAFAEGFETGNGFEDSDQPVDDLNAMSYTAYDSWPGASEDWSDELGTARRLASANVPAIVILGAEDEIVSSDEAAATFRENAPAARVHILDGIGHSPNVEAPEETVAMLEDFAKEAEVRPRRNGDANSRRDSRG